MSATASALESNVLVLNRFYLAVHITTVKRAFSLLWKQLAEVVHVENNNYATYDLSSWIELSRLRDRFPQDDGECVRTVSVDIRVPRIIRLIFYDRLPQGNVKFNRRNIYARDDNRCQYCGRKFPTNELSIDHVTPRSMNGRSTWEKVVCACTRCNHKK